MIFSFFCKQRFALALYSLTFAFSYSYAETQSLPEVVVTSSRTESSSLLIPMGVTVITSDEIQNSGARHANEALRWIVGVTSRINSAGGKDQTLDLRGFGEASASNQVILVDGIRQNEGDMEGNSLSWIPIEMIERIEIVRGSGSVLYGEGATAGTFNVITKTNAAKDGGNVSFVRGSYQTSEERISAVKVNGPIQLFFSGLKSDTDNHRENFASHVDGGSIKGIWTDTALRLSLGLSSNNEKNGLPGGITLSDFYLNPEKSYKKLDNGSTRTDQLTVRAETLQGIWHSGIDINRRLKQINSNYVDDGYTTRNANQSTRIGMRAWRDWDDSLGLNRLLVGYDNENWTQDRDGTSQINQYSNAVYLRNEMLLKSSKTSLFAGVRRTVFDRVGRGDVDGSVNEKNTSWETGISQNLSDFSELYLRLGKSFRLPNGDEFLCYQIYGTCPTITVNMLQTQQSKDTEIGLKVNSNPVIWSVKAYRHSLTNEISIGPDYFSNINLDPTRRQGIEFESRTNLHSKITLIGNLAYRQSTFINGIYSGSEIPFAPRRTVFASMQYQIESNQLLTARANWTDKQRISGDFSNSCQDQIPSYATIDTRYAYSHERWTYSAAVMNMTDKKYYNLRTRCDANLKSIYPEAGRTFLVSAQIQY